MKAAVIMGSKSDAPVLKETIATLKQFGLTVEAHVSSAHRTPERAMGFASKAKENGFSVIIAAAGKAAHLAGVLAAHTTLPVIGLPIKSSTMDGMDSLLSTVQMPPGIPVATVAINGGKNAALLAIQMMALCDKDLEQKLEQYKNEMEAGVLKADAELQEEVKEI